MPITKEQLSTIFSRYGFNDFQIQERGHNFEVTLSLLTPVQNVTSLKRYLNQAGMNQLYGWMSVNIIHISNSCSLATLRTVFSEYNPRVSFPTFQAPNPQLLSSSSASTIIIGMALLEQQQPSTELPVEPRRDALAQPVAVVRPPQPVLQRREVQRERSFDLLILQQKFSFLSAYNIQLTVQINGKLRFTLLGENTRPLRDLMYSLLRNIFGFNVEIGNNRYGQRIIQIHGQGNERVQSANQIKQRFEQAYSLFNSDANDNVASSSSSSQASVELPNDQIWNRLSPNIKNHWNKFSVEMREHIKLCVIANLAQYYGNITETAYLGDMSCPLGLTRAIEIPVHLPQRDGNVNSRQVYELDVILQDVVPNDDGTLTDPLDDENHFTLDKMAPASEHFQHLQQRAQQAVNGDEAEGSNYNNARQSGSPSSP